MSFQNRTVVITGASSGIGRSLTLALVRQGAGVGVLARRAELLESLVAEAKALGGTVVSATADVSQREEALTAIQKLRQQLGPVDVLIANAGIGAPTGAYQMNVAAVEQTLKVNFLGVVYAMEALLPEMIQRKSGRIAAISSLASYKGLPGAGAYCASKAAINSYMEALRIELYGSGVSLTTICPGFIETDMTARNPRPMPFLMKPDRAAELILNAIERRKKVYNFPWIMRLLMELSRWAPDRFIKKRVPISATNQH